MLIICYLLTKIIYKQQYKGSCSLSGSTPDFIQKCTEVESSHWLLAEYFKTRTHYKSPCKSRYHLVCSVLAASGVRFDVLVT